MSYIKNLSKSFMYAAPTVLQEKFKGINNLIAAVDKSQISELKSNLGEAKNIIEKEAGSSFSDALKESKRRLKSGKLYEKDTQSKLEDRLAGNMGMSDQDFGFDMSEDDDDFGFDAEVDIDAGIEDDSDSPKATIVNSFSGQAGADQITNASLESASVIAQTTTGAALSVTNTLIKSTIAQIDAVKESAEVSRSGFSAMNEFNAKMFGIQSDMLDKLSDIDTKLKEGNDFRSGKRESNFTAEETTSAQDIFDADGKFNLGAYSQMLVEKTTDYIKDDMFKMTVSMLSDPIARGMEVGMEHVFDSKPFTVFTELNNTLSALPSVFFAKMEKWRNSDNQIIAKLADFLTPDKTNSGFRTEQYEKGPIPFDGVTKRAITQVVPNLLSKILAAIKGQNTADELIYDFEKGNFKTRESAKRDYIDTSLKSNLSSNFSDDMLAMTSGRDFATNEDRKKYESKINDLFDTIGSTGMMFHDAQESLSDEFKKSDEFLQLQERYNNMSVGQKADFNKGIVSYSNEKASAQRTDQENSVLQQLYGHKDGMKELNAETHFSKRLDAAAMKKDILDRAIQVKIVESVPLGVYLVKKSSVDALAQEARGIPSEGSDQAGTKSEQVSPETTSPDKSSTKKIPANGLPTDKFDPNKGVGLPEGDILANKSWDNIAKNDDGKVTIQSILKSPYYAAALTAESAQNKLGEFLFGSGNETAGTKGKKSLFDTLSSSFNKYFHIFMYGKDQYNKNKSDSPEGVTAATSVAKTMELNVIEPIKDFVKDKAEIITNKLNDVVSYLFNGDDSVFGKLKTGINDKVITPIKDFATEKVWKPVKEFTTNTFESIADYGHEVFTSTKEYFFGEDGLFINMKESINTNIIQPAKDQLTKFGDNLKEFVWGTEENPGIARHAFNEFNSAITYPIRDFFMDEKDGVLVKFKNSAVELFTDVKTNLLGEPKTDENGNPITLMSSISTGIADKLFGEDHEVSSPKELFSAVGSAISEKMAPIINPMKDWVKDQWGKMNDFLADGAGRVNTWMSEKVFQPAGDFVKDKIFAPMNSMLFDEKTGLFAKGKTFFNEYLFGTGENSFYGKVLQPAGEWVNNSIIAPFQKTWKDSLESMKTFFHEQFIVPMGEQVFQPFVKELQFVTTDFKDRIVDGIKTGFQSGIGMFNSSTEAVFGKSIGEMLEEKVVAPIRSTLDGFRKMIGGFFKKAVTSIMNPIREKAENLKAKHIKSNLSRSGYVNEASAKRLLEDGRINYEDYSNWKLNRAKHLNKQAIKDEEKLRKLNERLERDRIRTEERRNKKAMSANDLKNEPNQNGFSQADQTVNKRDTLSDKADRAQIQQVSLLDRIHAKMTEFVTSAKSAVGIQTENVGGEGNDTIYKDSNVTTNKSESFTDRRVKNTSVDIENVNTTIADEVSESVSGNNQNLELLYLKSISSDTSDIMTFMKKNLRNVDANTRGILKALGGKKAIQIMDNGGESFIMRMVKAPFRMFGKLMGTTGDIAKNVLLTPFRLMSGIAEGFGKVITGAMSAVTKFVGIIGDAGKHIVNIVGTIGKGIADGIKGLITNAGQILTNLTKTVGDTLVKGVEGIGKVVDTSINVIGKAATSFGEVITKTAIPAISSLAQTTIDAATSIAKSVLNMGKDIVMSVGTGVAGIAGSMVNKFDEFRTGNKIQKVFVTGGHLDSIRSITEGIKRKAANDDVIDADFTDVTHKRLGHNPMAKDNVVRNNLPALPAPKAEGKRGKTAGAIALERKKEKAAKVVTLRQNLMLDAQQATAAATTSMNTGFGKVASVLMMLPAVLKNFGTLFMGSKAAGLGLDALGTAGDLAGMGKGGRSIPTGGKMGKMSRLSGWFKDLVSDAPNAIKRTKDSLMTAKAASNSNFMKSLTKVGKTGGLALAGLVGEIAADALSDGMADGDAKQVVKTAGTAMSYAGIGATIGSFIPGLGTAVGAGVGGALGIIVENFDSITKATGDFLFGADATYDDKGKLVGMRKPNMLARGWATLFGNDVEYDEAGNVIRYQSDSIFGKFSNALFGSEAEFDENGNLIEQGSRNMFGTIADLGDKMSLWWDDFGLDFSIGMTNFKDSLMTKAEDFANGIGDFFSGIGDKVSGLMSGIKNTAVEFWNSDDKLGYAAETASKVSSSISDTATSAKDSVLGWFGMSKADEAYDKFSGDVVEAKALTLFEEYKKGERYQGQLAKIAKYKDTDPSKYHDFLDRIETNLLERAYDDAEDMVDKEGLVKKTLQEYYATDSKHSDVEFTKMSNQDLGKWLMDNQKSGVDKERVQEIAGNENLYKSYQNTHKIKPTKAGYKPYGSITLAKDAKVEGMIPDTANRMMAMAEEYNQVTGDTMQVNSGYRSFEEQAHLYKTKPKGKAARPGNSMHNYGVAFDAQSDQMNKADKLGLLEKYGFHRPVGDEKWHVEDATIDRVAVRKQGQGAYTDMIAKSAPKVEVESDSEAIAANDESFNGDPVMQRKVAKAKKRAEDMRKRHAAKADKTDTNIAPTITKDTSVPEAKSQVVEPVKTLDDKVAEYQKKWYYTKGSDLVKNSDGYYEIDGMEFETIDEYEKFAKKARKGASRAEKNAIHMHEMVQNTKRMELENVASRNSKAKEVEELNSNKQDSAVQQQAVTTATEMAKANAAGQAEVVKAVKATNIPPVSIARPVEVDVDMTESNEHLGTQTALLKEISDKLGNLGGNVFNGDTVQQTNVSAFPTMAGNNNVPSNKGLTRTSVNIARNG